MHSVLYKKKQNLTGYIQYYKKNSGTDTKPMGKTEPQFLSDPMSDSIFFFANSVIPNVWYNSYLRFCPKGIDQCLILFLNYTSVDTEMCCPKGKCGCQYFLFTYGHRQGPGLF